jgi:hypothetical protein
MKSSRTGWMLATAVCASTGFFGCVDSTDVTDPQTDESDVVHPESDTPGSQVRLHEGTEGPRFAALVTQTPGMDVSSHQGAVNWSTAWANGAKFAYVKATEGTTYQNPDFAQQYNG